MNPQSLNRYAYVNNNPVNFVDPLGLDDCPPSAWYDRNRDFGENVEAGSHGQGFSDRGLFPASRTHG